MKQAKRQPSSIGEVLYSKVNRFECDGVLYHGTLKGKHQKKKRGGKSRDGSSLYYAKKAKQPWFLISSLPKGMNAPKKVVKLYRYRMQIEEGFRDTKNQQYGLGLGQAKSTTTERYNNLLLVAALALFLLWCMGKVAVDRKYHHQLQANTVRNYTVLSLIYLAMQIINDKRYKIKKKELKMVINNISSYTKNINEILND